MNSSHRWHAISLIELVFVLAVISIVIGFGVSAYGSAQRAARDQERKNTGSQIVNLINNHFRINGSYPAVNQVVWATGSVTVGGQVLNLRGLNTYSATSTTVSQTRYYYFRNNIDYILCVGQESGTWARFGESSTACPT